MQLIQQEITIPPTTDHEGLLDHLREACAAYHLPDEYPVRFVITSMAEEGYRCELSVLTRLDRPPNHSIFDFVRREGENASTFNAVMLIPTGIGAEIGGHAGDGNPAARLLASVCDHLITHPNVVNGSDINELPENGLYVEGSLITRLMMGTIGLAKVRANRVLLVMDEHPDVQIPSLSINAASAARSSLGVDIPRVVRMDPPIRMRSRFSQSGTATGDIDAIDFLLDVTATYRDEFDALALASVVEVDREVHKAYLEARGNMVNPWGGVEAMLTHAVSSLFDVPSAHAPMMSSMAVVNEITDVVDPRMAAEEISSAFLHCVLKGLHKSPRVVRDPACVPEALSVRDIACLVIPDGCVGLPTLAALEQGIPVVAVRGNKNRMSNDLSRLPFAPGKLIYVENYFEAAGVLSALKAGLSLESMRRPLEDTRVTMARKSEAVSTGEKLV